MIQRKVGKKIVEVRPSFTFPDGERFSYDQIKAELAQDSRGLLEEILRELKKQSTHMIGASHAAIRNLKRISRNTAKPRKRKKKKEIEAVQA